MKKIKKRTAVVYILIILYAIVGVAGVISNFIYWKYAFEVTEGSALCFAITGIILLVGRGAILSKCKQKIGYQNVQLDDKVAAEADDAAKANEFILRIYGSAIIAIALSMFILGYGIYTLQMWMWFPYSGSIGIALGSIGIILSIISIFRARKRQKNSGWPLTMAKTVIWISVVIIVGTLLIWLGSFFYFMNPANN